MEQQQEQNCRTCGYFRQHYIWQQRYIPIHYGHCVHPPRRRHCRPDMEACPKWIPQDEKYMKSYCPG